jgi:hypothetical protein
MISDFSGLVKYSGKKEKFDNTPQKGNGLKKISSGGMSWVI